MTLSTSRIIITGANRGIAHALAHALVNEGAHVIAHARDAEKLAETQAKTGAQEGVFGDLRDPDLASKFVGRGADTLILTAGILGEMKPLQDQDPAIFREVMEINVESQLRLYAALLPELLAQKGRVIWLSSGVGRFGLPNYGAYSVSKHAIEGLNRIAHAEQGGAGLVSIALAPGMVQTEMLRGALQGGDISEFMRPEEAATYFIRLLNALHAEPEKWAGESLDLTDF